MRKRIANLTSNILNPFTVILVIILLLSFESTPSRLDALRWSLILMAIGILPVFLAVIYLVRKGRLDGIFTSMRQQRTRVYALSGVCAATGYVVLLSARAPLMLQVAFIAGLLAAVMFLAINLRWKISLHTACVSALVAILILLYGWIAVFAVVLVPMIAWTRLELRQHSVAQVAAGALLAVSIIVVAFRCFGLA